jgi:hypothetical protein
MKQFFQLAAAAFAVLFSYSFAAEYDPADAVLVAYELTPDEEGMYSNTDGALSNFWSAWDKDTQNKLDYVHELPSTHGSGIAGAGPDDVCYGVCGCTYPGFTSGEDDAQLFVKAAWGEKGMYMLVEAVDDIFVGLVATGGDAQIMSETMPGETSAYIDAGSWMNDCFDMFLDIYPSDQLSPHIMANTLDYLTYTTYQYQYRFGSNEPASLIRINYVDPTWKECNPDCWSLLFNKYAVTEAEQLYQIKIETVFENEGKKTQEWLIPWKSVAAGIPKPTIGARTAVTFQYNDMDAMAADMPDLDDLDVLFFKNLRTPLAHRIPNEACGMSVPWGDIEFGGKLNGGSDVSTIRTHHMNAPVSFKGTVDYFSLSGKKIAIQSARNLSVAVAKVSTGSYVAKMLNNGVK